MGIFLSHNRNPRNRKSKTCVVASYFINNILYFCFTFFFHHSGLQSKSCLMITIWLLQFQSSQLNSSQQGRGQGNGSKGIFSIWINLFQNSFNGNFAQFYLYFIGHLYVQGEWEMWIFTVARYNTERGKKEMLGRYFSQLNTMGDAEINTQLCLQEAQPSGRIISFQNG